MVASFKVMVASNSTSTLSSLGNVTTPVCDKYSVSLENQVIVEPYSPVEGNVKLLTIPSMNPMDSSSLAAATFSSSLKSNSTVTLNSLIDVYPLYETVAVSLTVAF